MPLNSSPDLSFASDAAGAAGGASALGAISGIAGGIGVGLQIFGAIEQSKTQKAESQVSQQIAQTEQAMNAQREQQMMLTARRQQMQNYRTVQQTAARAKAAGVNQGGQFGSGVAGGLGGIAAQGATNDLGVTQNLSIGKSIFDLTDKQDQLQNQLASLQGTSATYAGTSAIGADIANASPKIGQLGSLAFGSQG